MGGEEPGSHTASCTHGLNGPAQPRICVALAPNFYQSSRGRLLADAPPPTLLSSCGRLLAKAPPPCMCTHPVAGACLLTHPRRLIVCAYVTTIVAGVFVYIIYPC